MVIQNKQFQNIKERMLDYLPNFFHDGDTLNDFYDAIAPEFESLAEFLVTPDVDQNNINPDIEEEVDAYLDNKIGWGFERFIQQFFIIGANHFLDEIIKLYNTKLDDDYIELRNKLLLYSALHRDVNEFEIKKEFDFIGTNLIISIDPNYPNYSIAINLSPVSNNEILSILQRQFDLIFPAHLSIVFISTSLITINDNPLKTLNDLVNYTIG